jgi:hypothetical protein
MESDSKFEPRTLHHGETLKFQHFEFLFLKYNEYNEDFDNVITYADVHPVVGRQTGSFERIENRD